MARHYKKNRISRKGKTPYQIYLDKRDRLKAEGYTLRPADDEATFMKRYENAKKAGITNFMRDYPKYDRYVNKADWYAVRKSVREANDPNLTNRYGDLDYEAFKKWDASSWTVFRDELLLLGYTWEEFRGIYE